MTWTAGQKLALEQIRDIEAMAQGSFELVRILPPLQHTLIVDLAIECEDFRTAPGGLPLRACERFMVHIPPDFPFDHPSVFSKDTRFAGFPHVQWGRYLCLYQSPGTEWDPSDGMFGFLSRLEHWLRRGALDEFETVGEPLHPPAAYHCGTAPLFVSCADTPTIDEMPWFGLASLRHVSNSRIDIVGWCDLFAENLPISVGAAILFPGQLPFEFPTNGKMLLQTLDEHGLHRKLLLLVLACAAHGGRDDEPLYVVVGARMRGIRGSADLRQHLTVWKLDANTARSLRLSIPWSTDTQELRELRNELQEITGNIIELSRVEWCQVREARPEIVTRRDHDAPISWFRDKTVAIWGCGALGGAVAEFLARAGVAKLMLRDSGIVAPGLLARQPYDDIDIGVPKAQALAARLHRIRPYDLEIGFKNANLLQEPLGEQDWTDGADVIVDASTSEAVIEKLELKRQTGRRVPVVSMVIGHRAEMGFVTLSGAHSSGGPKDVVRRAKLTACARNDLQHFANEFWPGSGRRVPFQPEPGCSEATFVGSWADVSTLAGSMLNLIARDLASNEHGDEVASAHILAAASTPINPTEQRQVSLSWPRDTVLIDQQSGYEVRIAPEAWREIRKWIENSGQRRGRKVETGGVLFGERNDACRVIWVSEVLGPPKDSHFETELFVCGTNGVATANEEKRKRTRESVAFVGLWHTHPVSAPVPSATDFEGAAKVVLAKEPSIPKVLLLIIGQTSKSEPWEMGAYVIARCDFHAFRIGNLTIRLMVEGRGSFDSNA